MGGEREGQADAKGCTEGCGAAAGAGGRTDAVLGASAVSLSAVVQSVRPQRRRKGGSKFVPGAGSERSGFRAENYFLPYQAKWIEDRARRRLMEKSRQIGISLCMAFDLVKKIGRKEQPYDAWVSSRDDLQARLLGNDCAQWARLLHRSVAPFACQMLDATGKVSAHVLPLDSGRAIYCLTSNPNAQAGKRGHRVFDEFALNPDNRLLYSVGDPGTLWGGGLDIISTHRGSANFFNELVNEARHKGNPKGFSLHRVTIADAVQDGLLGKLKTKWGEANPGDDRLAWKDDDFLQSLRHECADEETWLQEFMCVAGDDNGAFLSYDLIAGCEYGGGEWDGKDEKDRKDGEEMGARARLADGRSPLFAGVDIGREHDLTVIWVVERVEDVCFTRQVVCLEKATFAQQEETLYAILALPNLKRCCVDQTGLGRQFAERAAQRFGRYKVEGITFTSGVKEDLAYSTRAAFEKKAVRIPGDKFIRADLRSMRKEATSSGNIRFTGERTKNGHADRFWALALALHAARQASGVNRIFAQLI
jgi:phage FluMu gp28-like protein